MSPYTPLWLFGALGGAVEGLLWWYVNEKFDVRPRSRGVWFHVIIGFVVGTLAGAALKDVLT